ncbi:branched-chain amino acid ABC transporter permease/ATP-binding protein [Embleya hyalina]|uniref:ABC transporter n=1 Tax=Embleya hyalina TaxID=516124 RepID=A0A401YJQ9_9ACTN|nr:branched-chain amino acid ABC transporter permease/ATP-binding protein [Embleya hyalina]GCD94827.1 ABC transporter [Embleya hyalina]
MADLMTRQIAFDGLVNGLAIGLIALGVVLVYRSSRVINFAVGNLGVIGAALLPLAVINYGVPFWAALLGALLVGTLAGTIVELAVIRRLFHSARVTVLIATIGVAQACVAAVRSLPDVDGAVRASYPVAIDAQWQIAGVRVTGAQVCVLVVVPVVAGALTWFLGRTTRGRAVTACAENPDLARTVGISPKIVSTVVWTIAGLLSTLAMILIAGQSGRVSATADLGPNTMVRAMAAAVIAGLTSFRWSMLAGVLIGVLQAAVRFNFVEQTGLVDFLLLCAVVTAVWVRARRDARTDQRAGTRAFATGPRPAPIPERLRGVWWIRHMNKLALIVPLLIAVLLPLVVTQASRHLLYGTILAFAICACSLTVLTGWAGQLSLGQMAFAGLGALTAAALTRGLSIDIGGDRTIAFQALPFAPSVLVAALVTAALAAIVGVGALRVDGMLLAVSTFALGVAAAAYLYRRPFLTDGNASSVPMPRGDLLGLDLADERTYYYVLLVVLIVVLALLARLRAHGVGRRTIAVRDNPEAAAACTVPPLRTKVTAFALSGAIAGLGGALLAGSVQSVPLTERFFQVSDSLTLVAIVVIGGLGSTIGPVIGAVWVVGLPAFFPGNALVPLFASSIGLLVLLLYFPGGLAQIGNAARAALLDWAERRLPEPSAAPAPTRAPKPERPMRVRERAAAEASAADAASAAPVLVTRDVSVRYGGNTAVDKVSIELRPGEILGLIGTNGAGKSTLLNAIGGFAPATGSVELLGRDVSRLAPARRAALGLGRTFQAARLFPELTVRETVLVALEARGRSGLGGTALFLPAATRAERRRRAEAADLIDLVGLGRYADTPVARLSTGTRRIVELANLIALDARVLCLDEPTAGVAQRETEALGPLLLRLRRELRAAMIVIEHDMPFMMSISDRLYCLGAGRVISEGTPEEVRSDPAVIAGYLGTDTRAIDRSGALGADAPVAPRPVSVSAPVPVSVPAPPHPAADPAPES